MAYVSYDKALIKLARKYVFKGKGASGSKKGNRYYKKATRHIKRGAKYAHLYFEYRWGGRGDLDYAYYCRERGTEEDKKAMQLLPQAIECGHDMAVMQYAFFYMQEVGDTLRLDFKGMSEKEKTDLTDEMLKWINSAYELGFAPAAYMLAILYRDGYYVIEADEEKYKHYYSEFEALRDRDERQAVISANLPVYHSDGDEMKQLCYSAWIAWLR